MNQTLWSLNPKSVLNFKLEVNFIKIFDQETSSYAITYTVSDELSVTYGVDEIANGKTGEIDAEYSKLSASYTAGGMTISATMAEGDNTHHSTASAEDLEYWALGASFAF